MKVLFAERAWEDYLYWQATDRNTLRRINALINDAAREPFAGLGKPERLRGNFSGSWSRRINQDDRMVYHVEGDRLYLAQLRFHYADD